MAASGFEYPTFYVDDSACEIDSKKHVILAALTFPDEAKSIASWLDKKRECRLHSYDEIKWNNKSIPLVASSASSSTVAKAVPFIDGDYMGCIH